MDVEMRMGWPAFEFGGDFIGGTEMRGIQTLPRFLSVSWDMFAFLHSFETGSIIRRNISRGKNFYSNHYDPDRGLRLPSCRNSTKTS